MTIDPNTLLGGYTESELSAAFELVAPKPNWKTAISATLPSITSAKKRALISFAIGFYTGSEATWSKTPSGKLLVTAPGYYVAVGA